MVVIMRRLALHKRPSGQLPARCRRRAHEGHRLVGLAGDKVISMRPSLLTGPLLLRNLGGACRACTTTTPAHRCMSLCPDPGIDVGEVHLDLPIAERADR